MKPPGIGPAWVTYDEDRKCQSESLCKNWTDGERPGNNSKLLTRFTVTVQCRLLIYTYKCIT